MRQWNGNFFATKKWIFGNIMESLKNRWKTAIDDKSIWLPESARWSSVGFRWTKISLVQRSQISLFLMKLQSLTMEILPFRMICLEIFLHSLNFLLEFHKLPNFHHKKFLGEKLRESKIGASFQWVIFTNESLFQLTRYMNNNCDRFFLVWHFLKFIFCSHGAV